MVGATRYGIFAGLRERDAGLEAADHGDDVAPVARGAVEIKRGDRVDFGAGSKDGAEVEGGRKDADDGSLLAVDVVCLSHDAGVGIELATPPGVAQEDDGRSAVTAVVGGEGAAHCGLNAEDLEEIGDDVDAGGGMGALPSLRLRLPGLEKAK